MQDIIDGVRTFQRKVFPHYAELFEKLAKGQSPQALVVTCSDSRVDPFLFMNAEPGQLFVLRNAGNIVPKYDGIVGGVTATIEFAVVGLKVPNIIVCGHSGCGAIKGLLHPESLQNMPHVADWLHHHADPVLDILSRAGRLGGPEEMEQAVDANVMVQLENLRAHPSVAAALAAGSIKLHGWVYDIASGNVRAFNEQWKHFEAL
jgi:carbonic anhydrase